MAFWRATDVDLPSNSTIITVNTGDDVANVYTGYIIQINTGQFLEVKTVNTGASPQTIELFTNYTGSTITGGTAIAAPTQGAIKEAAEELRALRTTYEGIADSVASTPTANSVVKRTSTGQVKVADAVETNDAVSLGQTGTALTYDVTTSNTDTTAGRLTKVGDFGIGSATSATPTAPSGNLNNITTSGIYRVENTDTNVPATFNTYGTLIHATRNNSGGGLDYTQLLTDRSGNVFVRVKNVGAWSSWQELYHTGNTGTAVTADVTTSATDTTANRLLKVGDGGLLGGSTNQTNIDNAVKNLFLYGYEGLHPNVTAGDNPFPSTGSAFTGLNLSAFGSDAYQSQIAVAGSSIDPEIKFRSIGSSASGWSDWQEIYHTGNTNFNEFGGLLASDYIAQGFCRTTSIAWLLLPINSSVAPSSISIVGSVSDFQLFNAGAQSIISMTGATFTLKNASSNKIAVVEINGLSGLSIGDIVILETLTVSSKITVNF